MKKLNEIAKIANKTVLYLKDKSPVIAVTLGTIGVVAGTVMACKATTKFEEGKKDVKEALADTHDAIIDENYTEEDRKHDICDCYKKLVKGFITCYGPAIIVEGLSLGAIWYGHCTLQRRNVALTAAYTTLLNSFNEYRRGVVEKYGEEADKEIRLKSLEDRDDILDVTKDDFVFIFDSTNPCWHSDTEANLIFLRAEQSMANNRLQIDKSLTLNQVLERLGFQKTDVGLRYGWVYDRDSKGDNYVDFRIQELKDIYGLNESTIMLDFNVDGKIDYFLKSNRQRALKKLDDTMKGVD